MVERGWHGGTVLRNLRVAVVCMRLSCRCRRGVAVVVLMMRRWGRHGGVYLGRRIIGVIRCAILWGWRVSVGRLVVEPVRNRSWCNTMRISRVLLVNVRHVLL